MISKSLIILATLLGGGVHGAPPPSATHQAGAVATQAPATRVASRLEAREVVAKVQAFYTETVQLTAIFRQTYTNATFGKESVSDGKVWIKKPGKMRWDYQGKKKNVSKSFISDG